MKRNINRPVRSTSSQVVWVCLALGLFGIAVALTVIPINGMLDGWINSPTAYGLPTRLIYKNTSPHLYWSFVIFYLLGAVLMLVVAIGVLCETLMEQKRKIASQKKRIGADIQRK
jgi:hypothetical protein